MTEVERAAAEKAAAEMAPEMVETEKAAVKRAVTGSILHCPMRMACAMWCSNGVVRCCRTKSHPTALEAFYHDFNMEQATGGARQAAA